MLPAPGDIANTLDSLVKSVCPDLRKAKKKQGQTLLFLGSKEKLLLVALFVAFGVFLRVIFLGFGLGSLGITLAFGFGGLRKHDAGRSGEQHGENNSHQFFHFYGSSVSCDLNEIPMVTQWVVVILPATGPVCDY